jgi:hypothetical protein
MKAGQVVSVDAAQLKMVCDAATLFALGAPRLSREDLERHAQALLSVLRDFGAVGRTEGRAKPWEMQP